MKNNLYLALGSNLGERQENLDRALQRIGEEVGRVVRTSAYYETQPVGFDSPHLFLNAVAEVETERPVEEVLAATAAIERELGRAEKSDCGCYADRTIDIDLLLCGDLEVKSDALTLPHPEMARRRFVLQPLCELAPDLAVPGLGRTVKQLLDALNVARIEEYTEAEPSEEVVAAVSRLVAQVSSKTKSVSAEKLASLVAAPNIHLYLLYDENGTIQGMTTLAVDTLLTGTKAWVEDVVTDSHCRCRGYARQLLSFCEQEGLRLGAASLNLTSRPAREAANRLYRNAGFVQRETNVYKMALPRN